jgi:hypothetical protein
MTITIDIRRVLTLSFIGTFLVVGLGLATGCGAGFANNRSRSTYESDDGVTPVKRVTVTHEGSANGASVGLPMIGIGGGYGPGGYGNPVVGGGNLCMVHPDYCGTVITVMAPSSPPQGHPSAPGYGSAPQGTDPALEGRVTRLERKSEVNRQVLIRDHKNRKVVVGYLGSALMLNPQSCGHIVADPESLVIDGEPELTTQVRAEVLTKCAEILGEKGKN